MNVVPYLVPSRSSYQCPLTMRTFHFAKRSEWKDAFSKQQAHTRSEMQRLEQLAGRKLTYPEMLRESQRMVPAVIDVPEEAPEPSRVRLFFTRCVEVCRKVLPCLLHGVLLYSFVSNSMEVLQ